MSLSEEIRRKLIATFQVEQREHLQTMTQGLLALEKEPDHPQQQATLDEIFRAAHSMKGSARAVGMTAVESLGHALEERLMAARDGRLPFSPELFDLLYQALDAVELLLSQAESGTTATPAKVLTILSQLETFDDQVTRWQGDTVIADHPLTLSPVHPAMSQLAANRPSPTSSPPPPFAPSSAEETIRVSVGKLDALMAQLSELMAAKIRAEQRLAEAGQMRTLATAWQKQWVAQRGPYHRLLRQLDGSPEAKELAPLLTFVNQNQEQLRQFTAQSNHLYRQFANDMTRLSLVIDELEAEMKRVRMLPLSTITTPFYRMVRDLARQEGKQITLHILGSDMQLDRRLLEQVKDPLIHLLRNAVDHGIEPTAVRQQNGKPIPATITLTAGQQGNNITLTVSDDGAGLDVVALRETAVRKALLTPAQTHALSDGEAANLIFRPSFSTSQHVTELSGRGVGLDVARQNVEALNGSLSVASVSGAGTVFSLILPLTLASSRGLLLTAGGQTFALPLNTVERLLRVSEAEIVPVDGRDAILYQDKPVALTRLADLLELPTGSAPPTTVPSKRQTVVIISVAGRFLGLGVDSLEGEQEIVIKNLGPQLVKVGGFMGATTLGTGQNILVLHAADLLKLAAKPVVGNRLSVNGNPTTNNRLPMTAHRPPTRKTILVVDDSITTRTLEKNILEASGYVVKLATNGEEALSILATGNADVGNADVGNEDVAGRLPDLIITDITMPRLNGFDLTRRLKQDGRTKDIPVILVTALDAPADKARGIEVGADAYIVKSRFDQGNLLAMIEQLTL